MAGQEPDKLVDRFLKLLTDLRKARGLTHEELAARAGIHRTTIGLLERRERTPTIQVAKQLADAFDVPLSDMIKHAELIAGGGVNETVVLNRLTQRVARDEDLRNPGSLSAATGLDGGAILGAINDCYHTLDIIDEQLTARGSDPIGKLVELANLSSMIGNLLASGISKYSDGLYRRNRPHAYPDLLPVKSPAVDLEIKVALEKNKPKGHLPKAGTYVTFRYVLCAEGGTFSRGKDMRGATAWIWEAKAGYLGVQDFDISNTEGDSGKTATIKTQVFNAMPLIYLARELLPYAARAGKDYPGFN